MKIEALSISNFRGIREFKIENLRSMVVIAGPNGSGKSCVLDAIRLFKSAFGEYRQGELASWYGELHVQVHQFETWRKLFHDPNKPIDIEVQLSLSSREKEFISNLLRQGDIPSVTAGYDPVSITSSEWARSNIDRDKFCQTATSELSQQLLRGTIQISPREPRPILGGCESLLHMVFQTYDPSNLGIIDHHSAFRQYSREEVGGVELNHNAEYQRRVHSVVSNSQQKYANLKTEMVAAFVRERLVVDSTKSSSTNTSLVQTLRELFREFIPDKTFRGLEIERDGAIRFPVETPSGFTHDIDELSAGEKELLFGYLRLRNSAPRDSIVLLDEPELHLNPALVRGLPEFYRRNLVARGGNQIWLTTHSEAILYNVAGRTEYSVYHVVPPAASGSSENQALYLSAEDEVERAVITLVGSLATYGPWRPIVLLEGGGESEFDRRMVSRLFPDFDRECVLLSSNAKRDVKKLIDLLNDAYKTGKLGRKVYAIVDGDTEEDPQVSIPGALHRWPVYHIENFLLEPQYVLRAVQKILGDGSKLHNESDAAERLQQAAEGRVNYLLRHRIWKHVNTLVGRRPKNGVDCESIVDSIKRWHEEMGTHLVGNLSVTQLRAYSDEQRRRLEQDMTSDGWMTLFPGREVLREFVSRNLQSRCKYELFRDVILDEMINGDHKPRKMKEVIDKIHSAMVESPGRETGRLS